MHIFLTGAVGCGKSTVIRRSLALLGQPCLGGFRTITTASEIPGALGEVYIIRADDAGQVRTRGNLVGIRWGNGRGTAFPCGFEQGGCAALAAPPPDAALLLMDELGVMESAAARFCAAVRARLDGSLPILGVVKPKQTPLLDAVRAHPRVRLLAVEETNRDALPALVAQALAPVLRRD